MKELIWSINDILYIVTMADFESAIGFDYMFFLENYDIYNQFRSISDYDIDLLDFTSNTFNMYVTEAKIFGKKGNLIDDIVETNSFGNCPYLKPFPPHGGVDFKNKLIVIGQSFPNIPQEYFITGSIDLKNWEGNPNYESAVKAKEFLATLPDWVYPERVLKKCDVHNNHLYAWTRAEFAKCNWARFFPLEDAAKFSFNDFKILLPGEGFIIDYEGKVVGKYGICYDLINFYEVKKFPLAKHPKFCRGDKSYGYWDYEKTKSRPKGGKGKPKSRVI